MDTVFPFEFAKSWLQMYINEKDNWVKTHFYTILPNISYEVYPIKPNKYSLWSFKNLFNERVIDDRANQCKASGFKFGILTLNSKNLVCPISDSDILDETALIGVWIANVSNQNKESTFKSNPFIWSVLTKFVLLSQSKSKKLYSPSSDKNTFLICWFDEKNIRDTIEYYEFKITQASDKTQNSQNSWMLVDSEQALELDENSNVPDLIK